MRKILLASLVAALVSTSLLYASAKIRSTNSDDSANSNEASAQKSGPQLPPEEIINRFTKKESELREIWKEYAYMQESKLQVIGPADTVSGEFYQVSEFVFNDAGTRIERIIKAPPSTLSQAGLTMTAEDKNALVNLQPFALAAEELPNYFVSYVGKEKVDELNTFVFDVIPKVMSNKKELDRLKKQKIEGKFFQGKIWVDDQDLQIVKTAGKTVPEFGQRFPKFETYRENIDERFWLPTYTYGDDNLEFDNFRIHVRMVVRYKNYRRFQSDVKLLNDTEEVKDEKPASGAKPAAGTTGGKPGDSKKDDVNKEGGTKPKPRPRP
ncbi:MAG TPA: hypothetical protein VFV58_16655 [Blastocatellia bacterium]|jgi:hypothetical protein|nr:hypothetical protein [Blastocatellia bacterium]